MAVCTRLNLSQKIHFLILNVIFFSSCKHCILVDLWYSYKSKVLCKTKLFIFSNKFKIHYNTKYVFHSFKNTSWMIEKKQLTYQATFGGTNLEISSFPLPQYYIIREIMLHEDNDMYYNTWRRTAEVLDESVGGKRVIYYRR